MRYEKPKKGEWIQPRMRLYKMMCCDCGLVHRLRFRVIARIVKKTQWKVWNKLRSFPVKVQFQCERDNRATAAARRKYKTNGTASKNSRRHDRREAGDA